MRNLHASRFCFFLALATGLSGGVRGAAVDAFVPEAASLTDYLRRAQSANPGLRAFEQRYEEAMQRIPQASALPDPVLQVTTFVESVQTRTGPQENQFMLRQKIPWFGKLSGREAVASARAEALWFAYQNRQLAVARSVAMAFYEYAHTGEAIRLTRENRDLLRKLEPVVEDKVAGGADLNALLRLKVENGKVEDQLQSLEQKRVAQSARLSELLALSRDGLLPFPEWSQPEPVEPDGAALLRAIEADNPELQMLERKIRSAEARRELARLESYPNVSLGVNYIQIGDPVVNPSTPDGGRDAWGVTLSVNLPIWVRKNRAARAEALAGQRSLESEWENRYNELRAELSASLATLKDANRRLELYGNELLGLAEQAVENSRGSYESGRTGILEVIDSERSLIDLQLLYWRAAADAWQRRVTIQTLANRPILGKFSATVRNEPQKAKRPQH
ncbi:MAG: TolC family protein [Verrucomicrobia bacterium]|jgi:outer membrane protein TolC|nr:TolC family protein [Verrucomicrobiota bacterium]